MLSGEITNVQNFKSSQRMKVHATCGRGTEMFAVNEVKKKLNAEVVSLHSKIYSKRFYKRVTSKLINLRLGQ